MEPVQLTHAVWQIPFPVGHVHLVRLPDGYALVDTGLPGSAAAILDAVARLGGRPEDVHQIVLTHSHVDHMGSAAQLVAATGARVLAGAADAPFIRGTLPEPQPMLADSERPLHEQVMAGLADGRLPPLHHVNVDIELHDGDTLGDWGDPVHVVHAPGHTPGSIALHLPSSGVLFTGDAIATTQGRPVLGPFNVNRDQAIASFRRLAALKNVGTVCVPHGDPVLQDASALLRSSTPENDWP